MQQEDKFTQVIIYKEKQYWSNGVTIYKEKNGNITNIVEKCEYSKSANL